ncbi:uncharacterized protein B0H18DRAFT_1121113 [Fomitopsis serialis]|uniref:uncharacterized protein n=1 Tax=Fomitopsis serialis TaxID=139415 RepID=UPI0020080C25|nr:uncharacterized protein B0H18DRAFT_1121113 [Neoantrodia serialis]KAH9922096.1 hypothetical protein B0H18DRAFT_1121113 [Neoantrodia serialis]
MLLINVKHLSKDLPSVPVEDAPPAYEPTASTSYNPYSPNADYVSAELTATDVGVVKEDTTSPPSLSPPVSRPSLRYRSSDGDVTPSLPQRPSSRPARSELSLPSSVNREGDHRISRPYSTIRLSSAPLFDKSDKRGSIKSANGVTSVTLDASEIMSSFLRDLLTRQFAVEQSVEFVLKGCTDACRVYGLSLAALLQEPSIEGHTPIYWAVVKCGPGPQTTFTHELLATFLSCAAPLTETALADIRLACLENPDQELFQWIRRSRAMTPLFGAAEVLFSGAVPEDEVFVEELPGENDMFVGHFRILMFQKRMRVLKHVGLEFIARGRLWGLQVYVASAENARKMRHGAKPGAWVATISLLEGSQPAWVDSGFIVCTKDSAATRSEGNDANWLRLKSGHQLMAPPRLNSVSASFKEAFAIDCLSSDGPYVQPDGSLNIRLEASLKKHDSGCIIC